MDKLLRRLKGYVLLLFYVAVIGALSACGSGSSTPTAPSQDAGPDLLFTGQYDFKYESTLAPTGNDLYTLVITVKNQGTAPAKSVQVVAHSKGPGLEGDRPPLDNNGYYSVEAGETVEARFQFIFEKQYFGEYEFTIAVDPSHEVYELNESNNRLVFKRKF